MIEGEGGREGGLPSNPDALNRVTNNIFGCGTLPQTLARARTGISSHLGAKLRDWAVRQAEAGCYFWAALSPNDLKTR